MQDERARLVQNDRVGPNLFIMRLEAPGISSCALPGQFVHMQIPGMEAHILRRPFSLYAACAAEATIDILYQAVGFGSAHMTTLEVGCEVAVIGPLGNTWNFPDTTRHALLVGGGVGSAPLYMLAEKLIAFGAAVDIVIGAQTEDALVCHDRYRALIDSCGRSGSCVHCSTDDGSFGFSGLCTGLVEGLLAKSPYDYAAICGPEPMMKGVYALLGDSGAFCQVSMEKRMACGVGACLSCVVETTGGLKRTCVDGPIFSAGEVIFP